MHGSLLFPIGLGGFFGKEQKAMEEKAKEQAKTEQPELTREERLEVEEKAIQALIDMGVRFRVPLNINPVNPPKRIAWWNRHFPDHMIAWRDNRIPDDWDVTLEELPDPDKKELRKTYVRHFRITPLYLGTIDRIRSLYLQIEYDEDKLQELPQQEGKKLFKYIGLVAEIAAVAVLNNPSVSDPHSREVRQLKQFFIDNLSVNRLKRLADVISQMMNPGGFMHSIRSIREIGATKPTPRANLVEK